MEREPGRSGRISTRIPAADSRTPDDRRRTLRLIPRVHWVTDQTQTLTPSPPLDPSSFTHTAPPGYTSPGEVPDPDGLTHSDDFKPSVRPEVVVRSWRLPSSSGKSPRTILPLGPFPTVPERTNSSPASLVRLSCHSEREVRGSIRRLLTSQPPGKGCPESPSTR